ncbi:hypothetical protein BDW66DRAFT_148941 [Aspergillus desertorum]
MASMRFLWSYLAHPLDLDLLDLTAREIASVRVTAGTLSNQLVRIMLDLRNQIDSPLRIFLVYPVENLGQREGPLIVGISQRLVIIFVDDSLGQAQGSHLRPFIRHSKIMSQKPASDAVTYFMTSQLWTPTLSSINAVARPEISAPTMAVLLPFGYGPDTTPP